MMPVDAKLTKQTIPFVAREPDYFKGYGGKVIGAVSTPIATVTND